MPPSNEMNDVYDPLNLPKRMHQDYKMRIEQIVKIPSSKTRDTLASKLGK
jgi:hypothetical protein